MWKAIITAAVGLFLLFVDTGMPETDIRYHLIRMVGVGMMALTWLIMMRETKKSKNSVEKADVPEDAPVKVNKGGQGGKMNKKKKRK